MDTMTRLGEVTRRLIRQLCAFVANDRTEVRILKVGPSGTTVDVTDEWFASRFAPVRARRRAPRRHPPCLRTLTDHARRDARTTRR